MKHTIMGVIATIMALCTLPCAVSAQVRADTSAVVVLATNTTDNTFLMAVWKDANYHAVGKLLPHTQMIWVVPSAQLNPRDTLVVVLWQLVGTHQMQADTLRRRPGIVNIYRRDFLSGKPEPRSS